MQASGNEDTREPADDSGGLGDPPGGVSDSAGLPDASSPPALTVMAKEAIAIAESSEPKDHERLARNLLDRAYLDRLDPPEVAMAVDPRFLQLTRVLHAVAGNTDVLDRLSADPLYSEPGPRQAALIEASAADRSPGAELIGLWRSQLDPEADELETTIMALVRNQSDAAMEVLGEALASKEFETELVLAWLRGPVIEHRQDERLLKGLMELLRTGTLGEHRRFGVIEALFEYRPQAWYFGTGEPPRPPERSKLTDEVRRTLREIADLAVREGVIDAARRAKIEKELGGRP